MVDRIYCWIRIDRSFGHSLAEREGTPELISSGDEDKLIPASLEVLSVPELGAIIVYFSVGVLCERR